MHAYISKRYLFDENIIIVIKTNQIWAHQLPVFKLFPWRLFVLLRNCEVIRVERVNLKVVGKRQPKLTKLTINKT
jgi:hypothetical protein